MFFEISKLIEWFSTFAVMNYVTEAIAVTAEAAAALGNLIKSLLVKFRLCHPLFY